MYSEKIVLEINKLIYKIATDSHTSPETAKIAIHELRHTNNLIIDGMSYEYYMKNGDIKPLNHISTY